MAEKKTRLVAFDMEGCLTTDPTVWEIMHRKLGTWESHGLPYWNRYRAGEFPYDEFARLDVAVWQGAGHELLLESAREVPLMPGCAQVLQTLRDAGLHLAVISNGLACAARRFQDEFGVEHVFANCVEAEDGVLTGEVDIRVPYEAKGEVLRRLAAGLGVDRSEVAAVGDSTSDIHMFREAGLGIAFRPSHPSVAEEATHQAPGEDLRVLLELLL